MAELRRPKNETEAAALLALYADVDATLAIVEETRSAAIARANASADSEAAPLVKRLAEIVALIEPWWLKSGHQLAPKGRKSMELGGCMIGTKAGRAALSIAGDEQDVAAVLSGLRWAKPLLRVKVSLDKAAIMKSLDGAHSVALAELGISRREGEEKFFVERVNQPGTIGS